MPLLDFFHLEEVQYHRCLATEKGNKHCNYVAVHVYIAECADKLSERAINDTDTLALRETDLTLPLFCLFIGLLENRLHFILIQGNRPRTVTDEAGKPKGIPNGIP